MGSYVHRTTKQYFQSFSPNDLPEPLSNYIEAPDLSGVIGVPSMYWNIVGDIISEMSQAEKDAVDTAILENARDARIQAEVNELESVMRQLVKMIVSEINILRQQFNTTTAEMPQATDTNFYDRTLEQVKAQLRNDLGT